MAKNVSNLMNVMNLQIIEAQCTSSIVNPKRSTMGHILTKLPKKENTESSQTKDICHIQGVINNNINKFLSRKLIGKKAVG